MGKDTRRLVVSCIPCNKRVELPIDDATLTFTRKPPNPLLPDIMDEEGNLRIEVGTIRVADFIAYPHILCKDCLGAANVEVINE